MSALVLHYSIVTGFSIVNNKIHSLLKNKKIKLDYTTVLIVFTLTQQISGLKLENSLYNENQSKEINYGSNKYPEHADQNLNINVSFPNCTYRDSAGASPPSAHSTYFCPQTVMWALLLCGFEA